MQVSHLLDIHQNRAFALLPDARGLVAVRFGHRLSQCRHLSKELGELVPMESLLMAWERGKVAAQHLDVWSCRCDLLFKQN